MRGCCCGCARSAVAPPSPGQWTCRASMWWHRPRTHPAAAAARPSRAPDVPPASAPTNNAWLAGGCSAHCACCPAPACAAHPACCARCCRDRALNGSAGVEKDRAAAPMPFAWDFIAQNLMGFPVLLVPSSSVLSVAAMAAMERWDPCMGRTAKVSLELLNLNLLQTTGWQPRCAP